MALRNRKTFWTSDWFTGVVFTIVFVLVAFVAARTFFYGLETAVYDRALTLKAAPADQRVVVVAIDEQSIRNIGRFPFSRDVTAEVVDQLQRGGAKVVTSTIVFPEAQIDPGIDYLRDIDRFVADSTLASVNAGADEQEALATDVQALRERLQSAISSVAYDQRLAQSITAAGNVVLPLQFGSVGAPAGRPDLATPAYVTRHQLDGAPADAIPFSDMAAPIAVLAEGADALGHISVIVDEDGALRFEPLVADHYGELYPSLALVTAARALNLTASDIVLAGDPARVQMGGLTFPTSSGYRYLHHFYPDRDGQAPFRVESFYDVFTGQIPLDTFRDKVVLVGATAAGVGDNLNTPVSTATAPVMVLAHSVSSLLQEHYVTRPGYAPIVELAILALLALYVILVIPRLRAGSAALISALVATALLVGELQLLSGSSLWLQLVTPLALLLSGHLVMTVKRFGVTERMKSRSDEAGAESNRMLGLAFQGQGQLDLAFEKFRQCPLDDALMEPLYNLALDYERKRQFSKAGVVYELMSKHAPTYKDLATRLQRSKALDETVIFGSAHGQANQSMLLDDDDGVQKPMLGRYLVEKEIGKGAMGTVYLGRDPKINRVVAIKTIAISQEFDQDEVASVRERFFREAETAGRLNHPDIVTVYDAGEEHDLAYIAMEFLKGHHLSTHTRAEQLLPEELVITMMARVADALAYAHKEDVVHRDIKPANIMYDPESGDLKITDFGIARITSSSKTKTGIVLGTPSYMSPEQLAGKNVTGRSDLFSLGVTLYQLLAGQLPFRADSMATLMYKIANEPHTPLRAARPELPACLEQVVDRALDKDVEARYQSGAEMALDLRECQAFLAA